MALFRNNFLTLEINQLTKRTFCDNEDDDEDALYVCCLIQKSLNYTGYFIYLFVIDR